MSNKLLITGYKGFIGNTLFKYINGMPDIRKSFEISTANGVDLTDFNQVKLLPKFSIIIHLAAKTFIPDSFKNSNEFYRNNFLSTLNILEKAKMDGARVIYLSTYIYGNPQYLPVDEIHPIQPLNPYTQSKVLCEELCEAFARDFLVPITVLRPFNIYGPGQASNFLIPHILSQLSGPRIYLKDSRPKRDFLYIDDLILLLVNLIKEKSLSYEVFNVGSGISYSVDEIVNIILKLSKSAAKVQYEEISRPGEVNDCFASIHKLFKTYGWRPTISIYNGIEKVLAANKNQF